MNKIKRFFLNIFYGLPFGLKGANAELTGGITNDDNGIELNQEVSDERVAKHLLKGEVTQEVEELRYRTYAVANKSEDYQYLGNGLSVKNEKNPKGVRKKYKFSQDNENICQSVLSTLKQVGSYGIDKYRFEMNYNSFVRFNIEKYATRVDVKIDEDDGIVETTLHFSKEANPYDKASKPFINELMKLLKNQNDEHEVKRNEISSSINDFSFVTYKANNEDDLVTYSFMNGSKFKKMRETEHEVLMTLSWDEYMRVPLDLEAKYYSRTMAEKYAKKEKKNNTIGINDVKRKRYCSVCGKEMSVYDGDIQEASGQAVICQNCMNKAKMAENQEEKRD